jgi:hypothetical protein
MHPAVKAVFTRTIGAVYARHAAGRELGPANALLMIACLACAVLLGPGFAVGSQLTASWTDNSGAVAGVRLERRLESEGGFTVVAEVPPGVTAHVDSFLSPGTRYCYRAQAHSSAGVSAYSNEACATSDLRAVACCRDLNGDGRADILWRQTSGTPSVWLLNGATVLGSGLLPSTALAWTIVGTGDFNGDGKAEILWRHSSGALALWSLEGSLLGLAVSVGTVTLDWAVAAIADLNGDGKDDILWRHVSGTLAVWLLDGFSLLGGFQFVGSGAVGQIPPGWSIKGVGDFNGDGRADILWRHTSGGLSVWLFNGVTVAATGSLGLVSSDWTVAGVGDINGDGRADVVWRHTSGAVAVWFLNGSTFIGSTVPGSMPSSWTIVGTGDFDGDGRADVLWRDAGGNLNLWLMNAGGGVAQHSLSPISASWIVQ